MRARNKHAGLTQFLRDSTAKAAKVLFQKARLAGDLAESAIGSSGRSVARRLKQRHLDAALRLSPHLFRRFPDPRTGRWIFYSADHGSIHGRRLDDHSQVS